ncbi:hypothetical protein PHPALM_31005 [Phytophthora palmivora]|uniref:RxLR effector n=1 Tax=Phytophthora palmivora TaxID=4796 RepID=A0A2P4X3P5_9STRA|nr:hypothetical protein PHPALM_31005 [Phytophthora palmivora]
MQGLFALAFVLLNSWLGGTEAADAAHASNRVFSGGYVVEKNCNDCTNGPTMHTLLKHTDNNNNN